jgi:hypothetical protein
MRKKQGTRIDKRSMIIQRVKVFRWSEIQEN